ncbi:MAG: hypothetical protein JW840_09665 [Candidatus Thermoplasmatota archaeon]|nr:hypothetical protein [Candidatus Thermoplasmatota archaeon]
MGRTRVQKKSDVLSASEIGQYTYCSVAWFLQRCGYEAESLSLETGKQVHTDLGERIDGFSRRMRSARWSALFGLLIFFIGFLLFLFEVIL